MAVGDPRLGQRPLDGGALLATGAEHDGGCAVEADVRRPGAVVRAVPGARQAGGVRLHEEQPRAAVDHRGHHQDVGAGAAGHGLLDAGQGPAVAGLRGGDALGRRAPPGAGLGVREHGERRPLGDAAEDPAALLGRADRGDQPACQDDGLDERLGCEHPSDLLGDDRHLDRPGPHAAVLLGEGETEQAHLGQPRPGLLVEAGIGRDDGPALLAVGVGPRQEPAHGFPEVVLLAVVVEVHCCHNPRIEPAMMVRCTSLEPP
jgi:hypothetical protein